MLFRSIPDCQTLQLQAQPLELTPPFFSCIHYKFNSIFTIFLFHHKMFSRNVQRHLVSLTRSRPRLLVPRQRPARVLAYSGQSFSQGSIPSGPDPTDQQDSEDGKGRSNEQDPNLRSTILKMAEAAATTFASIAVLGYVFSFALSGD